jgi:hypothetical protein
MKSMDFFDWQGVGGVNSGLLTTSATQAGGKRRDFMLRYGLGLVLGCCALQVVCHANQNSVMRYHL